MDATKKYKYDIAVSYASEQQLNVERIVTFLKKRQINIFFAPEKQHELIVKNILQEFTDIYLNQSNYILVFISKEYMQKDITKNELAIALSRTQKGDTCLIPVFMDDTRPTEINSDLYYFVFSKESEYSLAEKISKFIRNSEINSKEQKLTLPNNIMIFLSGATGVGKTTTARKLMKLNPEILVMEEIDLIREAIRSNTETIANKLKIHLRKEILRSELEFEDFLKMLNYGVLTKSTSDLNYEEMLLQAYCISEPLKQICWRLREKKLPAIFEGVNLPFEALFTPFDFNENFFLYSSNMIFINLYLKDEQEHKRRIKQRAIDRGLSEKELAEIMRKFPNIRQHNLLLHQKAMYYSEEISKIAINEKNKVHSIDISGDSKLSIDENTYLTVQRINSLINALF